MLPASCSVPSSRMILPPTAPMSGLPRKVARAARSEPGKSCASLLSNRRYWPRACSAAWFTANKKLRFSRLRMIRAPRNRSSRSRVSSDDALSTMMTSIFSEYVSAIDRRQANVSSERLKRTRMIETSGSGDDGSSNTASDTRKLSKDVRERDVNSFFGSETGIAAAGEIGAASIMAPESTGWDFPRRPETASLIVRSCFATQRSRQVRRQERDWRTCSNARLCSASSRFLSASSS